VTGSDSEAPPVYPYPTRRHFFEDTEPITFQTWNPGLTVSPTPGAEEIAAALAETGHAGFDFPGLLDGEETG
jgi:hypothetical protein